MPAGRVGAVPSEENTMKRSHVLIIAAAILAVGLFLIGCPPRGGADAGSSNSATGPAASGGVDAADGPIPGPAPDLEFTDLNGKRLSIKSQAGDVVVLYFWATYCSPCLAKLPRIEAIAEAYKDKGVVVWALSEDPDRAMVDGWLQQNDLSIPVALVGDDVNAAFFPGEKPLPIPRTIIIDRGGRIIARLDADASAEEVEELVKPLVE